MPAPQPTRPSTPTAAIAEAMARSPFAALGLAPTLVRAVVEEGYTDPSPIQQAVIPSLLQGRDVLACAQTGTGKTAAFALPLLQRLAEAGKGDRIRALILSPTRELAIQIAERLSVYGGYLGLRHVVIYGGVSQQRQESDLRRSPDILVATPGRLVDLMQQGLIRFDGLNTLILDEADRMLDMGFIRDVRRIVDALPKVRQTLLFSATMPADVQDLARSMLANPVRVDIAPTITTAERVDQSIVHVSRNDKRAVLEHFLRDPAVTRAIVFTRTKHGANRLAKQLEQSGIGSAAIHGNKSQNARERALDGFRDGEIRVLVATDVAARGIDVDGISHVFNYELPNIPESYVHRIGRTGRAGASGLAISFCDHEERAFLADIEKFIRQRVPVIPGFDTPGTTASTLGLPAHAPAPVAAQPAQGQHGGQRQGGGFGGQRGPQGPRGGQGGQRPQQGFPGNGHRGR